MIKDMADLHTQNLTMYSIVTNFKLIALILCLQCICISLQGQAQDVYDRLKAEFADPPIQASPKTYWWWLNGNIDTVRIREEIQSMKQAGLSGFDIFEI